MPFPAYRPALWAILVIAGISSASAAPPPVFVCAAELRGECRQTCEEARLLALNPEQGVRGEACRRVFVKFISSELGRKFISNPDCIQDPAEFGYMNERLCSHHDAKSVDAITADCLKACDGNPKK